MTSDLALFLLAGSRLVFHPHGMLAGYRRMLSKMQSLPYIAHDAAVGYVLTRKPAAVIASTRIERQDCLAWGVSPERLTVIPEGVDDDFYAIPARSSIEKPHRLLYVGRLSRDRNIEALIDAVAYLKERKVDAMLRVVGRMGESTILGGSSSVSRLRQRARDLGVARQVNFVGELAGQDLVAEFGKAHVFVYSARYESFGQALAQAAAAGLPIVTTPVGVAEEIVRTGESGWVVPHDHAIGPPLLDILGDPGRLSGAGRAARRAAERFRWAKVVAGYERLYAGLLQGNLESA